jgi:uncharacterized protein (DUF2267 family)
MEYERLLENVEKLDFIPDRETAEAAIKAVLGTLASRMKDVQAHRFADTLPEPLTYNKLRGHQINITSISLEQFVRSLGSQFKLNIEQTQTLIRTIFRITKESTPRDSVQEWEQGLPEEWKAVVENA